jgi:hypothetical protein
MTPEEECRAFYAALGEAITEWSHVEDGLYMVLERCLRPADHQAVAAGFYALDHFRSKLAMTDAVAIYCLAGSTHLEAWQKLHKAIERRIKKRNELAHHQVEFDPKAKERHRYKLIPALLDPRSPKIGINTIGLHLSELQWRIGVFKILFRRIRDFVIIVWP